jgi:hypothetical protein
MKALRTFLHAALGLLLLVQGVAVSAAGADLPQADSPAAAMDGMPCHGDPADAATPSCCDVSCPDMLTCAGANLALATDTAATSPPSADRFRLVRAEASLPTPRATFLLRPPIALHG